MAPSKVMATTSTSNSDMPRQQSLCTTTSSISAFLLADLQKQQKQSQTHSDPSQAAATVAGMGISTMENPYACPTPSSFPGGASFSREGSFSLPKDVAGKSVDEVWKDIVANGDQRRAGGAEINGMTLEDFLTKAGAVSEGDVVSRATVGGVPVPVPVPYGLIGSPSNIHNNINGNNNENNHNNNSNAKHHHQGYGNGMMMETAGRGRGKRMPMEELPVDNATQQKQRRMIKNRESAARSRERKQAYTVELESLVTQLEEETAQLLKEEAEENKERLKQLMKNIIPVMEKRRPSTSTFCAMVDIPN